MQKQIWIASACALALLMGCSHEEAKPAPAKKEASKSSKPAPKAEAKAEAKAEVKAPSASVDTTKAVMATVESWADAWSKRDVDDYLSFYAKDFKPEKGSRTTWEKQRRDRIGKAKHIKITIAGLQVTSGAPDRATAKFKQTYESDTHKDTDDKKLDLHLVGDKWQITREQ